MNWDIVKGNWSKFKGEIQSEWGKLTDDDLDQAAGERQQLAGKIQERYGMAKADAERALDDFIARNKAA